MNLKDAMAFIEDGMELDAKLPAASHIEICSGGIRLSELADPPALYLTESAAIDAWQREVNDLIYAHDYERMRYVMLPKIERLQMTMMERGSHRLVSDRFYVWARIAFARGIHGEAEEAAA